MKDYIHVYYMHHEGLYLTVGTHAQEGYGTCLVCVSVCVSVCYHSSGNIGRSYAENVVRRGLS